MYYMCIKIYIMHIHNIYVFIHTNLLMYQFVCLSLFAFMYMYYLLRRMYLRKKYISRKITIRKLST